MGAKHEAIDSITIYTLVIYTYGKVIHIKKAYNILKILEDDVL